MNQFLDGGALYYRQKGNMKTWGVPVNVRVGQSVDHVIFQACDVETGRLAGRLLPKRCVPQARCRLLASIAIIVR